MTSSRLAQRLGGERLFDRIVVPVARRKAAQVLVHGVDGVDQFDAFGPRFADTVGRVMNEGAEVAFAEFRVVLGEEEERVPALVDHWGRDHVMRGRNAGEPQEALQILEQVMGDFRRAAEFSADPGFDVPVFVRHDLVQDDTSRIGDELGHAVLARALRGHDPYRGYMDPAVGVVDEHSVVDGSGGSRKHFKPLFFLESGCTPSVQHHIVEINKGAKPRNKASK